MRQHIETHLITAASKVVSSNIETIWNDLITSQQQLSQQATSLEDILLMKLSAVRNDFFLYGNGDDKCNSITNIDDGSKLINSIEEVESIRDQLHGIKDQAARNVPLIASTKAEREKYMQVAIEASDMYMNLLP